MESFDDDRCAFNIEAMLAGWAATHSGGSKVTFWVSDEDLEAFRGMTVKKGNVAGQRFRIVGFELSDDETIARQRDKKPGPLLQSSLVLCRTESFQAFVWQMIESESIVTLKGLTREQQAAGYVKSFCQVDSRKLLDSVPRAADLFSRLMSLYREWMATNGIDSNAGGG